MYSQEELIREEQTILNSLIREMDSIILKKNQKLTAAELQVKKQKTNVYQIHMVLWYRHKMRKKS